MQRTIWKFPLDTIDNQDIEMPSDYELLAVQVQNGSPQLWALVDPETPPKAVSIRIVGTGHRILDEKIKYVGSYQLLHGALVYHCFELLET